MIVDFRVRLPEHLRPASIAPREYTEQYDAVLDTEAKSALTIDDLFTEMMGSGVGRAVVHAEYEYGDPADALNAAVARVVEAAPDQLSGVGTVSLERPQVRRMIDQVNHVHSLGLIGLNLQPSFFGIPMVDRRLYPVFARAEELGLLVALHSGVNYTTHQIIENDHPRQLDQLACDFPALTLVACHAGWPWVPELVAVMRKHPTVLADFGGLAPKYVGEPDAGWSVMRRFMNSLLQDQVLFATDWPVFPLERAVAEWQGIGLKDSALLALLGGNAQRLMERARAV